jgi:hypothetical protein
MSIWGNYSIGTGSNSLGFPSDDFLGARRGSSSNGAAPSSSAGDVTMTHRFVVLGVLLVVGYGLWHYSQTH